MPPVEQPLSSVPKVLQKMPFWDRTVGNLLHVSEGENGLSWMSFLRDTSVAWLPKLVVSRSLIEISESTFIEFLESGVVYFSVPLAAKGMHHLYKSQAQKGLDGVISREFLHANVGDLVEKAAKPGNEALKKQLPYILSKKAATILGPMVAVGLGCEYLINYSKNLMTAKVFKKDKFSDVVNLSSGGMKTGEKSEVVSKSAKRALTTLGIMAGTFASSIALARFGHKLPQNPKMIKSLKNSLARNNWKKLAGLIPENPMAAMVKHFDYDVRKGGFSLSGNQLRWYMLASIPAYADAARDKFERVESVTRLGMIMGYLAFGQQALEKGMLGIMKRYRPDLYNAMMTPADAHGKRQVMKLDEVVDKSLRAVEEKAGGRSLTVKPGAELLRKSDEQVRALIRDDVMLKKAVAAKNVLFGVPMVVGILGTGIGVSLLNQFWTKYRFQKAQQGLAVPPEEHRLTGAQRQQLAQIQSGSSQKKPDAQPSLSSPFGKPAMAVQGFGGYYRPASQYPQYTLYR